jgi:putative hydrolase of the HAD superfamily
MTVFGEVRAVVFDAVGTLINADPPVASVYHQAGARYGSSLPICDVIANLKAAIVCNFLGETSDEKLERSRWRQVVAETFSDIDDTSELFRELWDHFANAAHWRAADDAEGVCRELNSRGYAIAVGSNFDARLIAISRVLSPLDSIGSIYVSSQVGYSKPHPEFFRRVQDSLQLEPSQLLMVGDSQTNDYAAPRAAGWQSLWLAHDSPDSSADVITSLADVVEYLS